MSQRTVAQKMGLKSGMRAWFSGAPEDALAGMALPDLDRPSKLTGAFDHIHLFVRTQAELDRRFPTLKSRLAPAGRLWISWPKGNADGTDLTIRHVIRIGYTHGLVESTCLSIDSYWSALRFTHPKPGKTYANSYGTLPES